MTRQMQRSAVLLAVLLAGCSSSSGSPAAPTAAPTASPVPAPSAASTIATPSLAPTAEPPTPAPTEPPATSGPPPTPAIADVVLLTHDSFALSDSVIAVFHQQTGYTLKILQAGDAGAMVNQAILSKSHPLGDVLFGVDNTFLSRALDAGIFEPYVAAGLDGVPAQLQLDAQQHRVTPIDYGDVCIDLDKQAFATGNPAPPATLADLIKPAYKNQLVVENPATSSPGLAFVLATIARFGDSGWLGYWSQLRDNGVHVSSSWDDAYNTQFSAGPGHGPDPIVVSYASDPAADVVFADPPISEPTISVMPESCFRQVEFAGVLVGAANPAGAQAFVDFLLSPVAQADVPLQMFVYPSVTATALPDVFTKFALAPTDSLSLDPVAIGANRDRWIEQWTTTVLR